MGKRRRRSNVGDHWLEDWVTGILLRLPVKSLVRFRCVAKTWQSLFPNPWFVSQHLSISKKKNKRLLVCYNKSWTDYYYQYHHPLLRLYFQLDQSRVSYQDFPFTPQVPQNILISSRICVCDGLLCLYDNSTLGKITLWNPATREFIHLPKLSRKRKWLIQVGFGWDSSSNDYKVICMWRDSKQFDEVASTLAAVYRMRSNSWRMLEDVD